MPTGTSVQERDDVRLKEPKHYHVVMHNDDFTTMEFVVEILMSIFQKDAAAAQELMLQVHRKGRAVVGTYPFDIACTKVQLATTRARAAKFPFRMTVEEA